MAEHTLFPVAQDLPLEPPWQKERAVQGARKQRDSARGRRKGQEGEAGGRQGSHRWLLGQLWSLVLEVPQLSQGKALHILASLTVKPVA